MGWYKKINFLIGFLLFVFFSCNYTKKTQNNNDYSIHKTSIIDTVSIVSLIGNDTIDKYLYQFKKISVDSIIPWATDKKIVSGISNNNFNPNKSISREQLIVMLYNYYKLNNKLSNISENLSNFYDYTDVSPWAKEAMTWATSKGIINGNNGNILPKNDATRAEVAIIIQKYMELAK